MKDQFSKTIAAALAAVMLVSAGTVTASAQEAAAADPEQQAAQDLPELLTLSQETFTDEFLPESDLDYSAEYIDEDESAELEQWLEDTYGKDVLDEYMDDAEKKGSEENYYTDFYYDQLTSDQKAYYDNIKLAVEAFMDSDLTVEESNGSYFFPTRFQYVGNMTSDEGLKVYYLFCDSNPQYFFMRTACNYSSVSLNAKIVDKFASPAERKSYKQQIDIETAQIMENVRYIPEYLPYEREKCIYKYLIDKIDYVDKDAIDQTIAGALVDGECVCKGYAAAMTYLCNAAGIPCHVEVSPTHAWNSVELYGNRYLIDVTWMDTGENYRLCNVSREKMLRLDDKRGKESHDLQIDYYTDDIVHSNCIYDHVISDDIDYSYGCNVENGVLTSYTFDDTYVNIPEGVTSIADNAFKNNKYVAYINIPEGVTSIGNQVFSGCPSLDWISIPSTVSSIGSYLFFNSYYVEEIKLAEDSQYFTMYDDALFSKDMTKLIYLPSLSGKTAFSIPSGVTTIDYMSIYRAASLTELYIPASVKTILSNTFTGCSELATINFGGTENEWSALTKYVSVPAGCTVNCNVADPEAGFTIENGVLKGYSGEGGDITIPASVREIGENSLYGNENITSITIPAGLTNVGYDEFQYCNALESINVDADNQYYSSENGVLFDKQKTKLICYPKMKSDSTYTIPESVNTIGYSAFFENSFITSVTLPTALEHIGGVAFGWCSSLEGLSISEDAENFKTVDGVLFSKDETLIVLYPAGRDKEGIYYIPEGVTTIGDAAFFSSQLCGVVMPDSVNFVGNMAYAYQLNLRTVNFSSKLSTVSELMFAGCYKLIRVYLPENIIEIADNAFCDSGLMFLTAETGLKTVGSGAFSGCDNLCAIFYKGTEEQWYAIDMQAAEVSENAYYFIESQDHFIDESEELFYTGKGGAVTVPAGQDILTIGDCTFSNRVDITSINIEAPVTDIGSEAFFEDVMLKTVTLPGTLKTIGENAFSGCCSLTDIYFRGTQKQWAAVSKADAMIPEGCTVHFAEPEKIKITAVPGDGFVSLSWDAYDGAVKYAVKYYDETGASFLANNRITGTSFKVTGLTNREKYTFVIQAYNGKGWTAESSCEPVTAMPVGGDYVTGTAAAPGDGFVTLKWDAFDGAVKYAVTYIDATGASTLVNNKIKATSYKVTGLTNRESYTFIVQAYNGKKWTAVKDAEPVTAMPVGGDYVTGTAAAPGDGFVTLSWDAFDGAVKYAVTYVDTTGASTLVNNKITATSYKVTGLTNRENYTFIVQAYNGKKWTAVKDAEPVTAMPVGGDYVTGTAAAPGDGFVTLKWDAFDGAVKYAVTYVDATGASTLASNRITATSYKVTGLTNRESYTFIVQAYNGKKWTAVKDAEPVTATPASGAYVTGTSAERGATTVTLSWDVFSGAVKYAVTYYDKTGASQLVSNKITAASYTVSGLVSGETYTFIVQAYNGKKWTAAKDAEPITITTIAKM